MASATLGAVQVQLKLRFQYAIQTKRSVQIQSTLPKFAHKLTKSTKVILITVFSILGVAVLIGIGLLIYKSYKKRQLNRASEVAYAEAPSSEL